MYHKANEKSRKFEWSRKVLKRLGVEELMRGFEGMGMKNEKESTPARLLNDWQTLT
jgi:hypothetical protein